MRYFVRCRNSKCRHRKVMPKHPDEYAGVPRCPMCGSMNGWRTEAREYNKRGLCDCCGPDVIEGRHYPHRTTHRYCDQHPHGYYNQARQRGVADEDIPKEYRPK